VSSARICVVTAGGPYAWIIANALADRFGPVGVIRERPEPMGRFLARRARTQGWLSVGGQAVTMAVGKLGKRWIARRLAAIEAEEGLEPVPRAGQTVIEVASINSEEFLAAAGGLRPEVVLLVGCRLMKADVLARISCPVLNYHAGITPRYRGMNGGYWALASGDRGNFGATVHLVDPGVDTGGIIRQVRGEPRRGDSIMTYPHRLAAMARPICIEAVDEALAGRLSPQTADAPSGLWRHPPIWTYLRIGLRKGVW
jgi:methionyl-tRNA formyltransferase